MRNLLLLTVSFLFLFTAVSQAQIVAGNVFLQGHWIEAGVDNMGALGTCTSPPGYHAHGFAVSGTATCSSSGDALDVCYDWGHDGWGVGTPCEMGDYTIPGVPQEGWSIQVGATEYRNWEGGGLSFTGCTGYFAVPGSIVGYSNSGGVITGTFSGNVAGLSILQETRVDTEGSAVIVTTRMYNTTAAVIPGVYYERTCDPDNSSFWPGGTSATINVIVHQNEDSRHDVMIGTYSSTGYNRFNSYMGLATKDCRAKCMVISGLYPSATPSAMFGAAAGASGVVLTAYPDSNNADEGIALIFNIGNIQPMGTPGDSAVVSYAYVFNGTTGIDSALPDPQLVVNGSAVPNNIEPNPTTDTFNTCAFLDLTSIPVEIINATDKDWTWSKWTWAPSTGLSSTTGVMDTVNLNVLTGPITYTITGTDSVAGTMLNCNQRVFYLTILPCHTANNNGPCAGDTLKLGDRGDSTGATYVWSGPGGFTSTLQNPYIYPATLADAGLYHVIKMVGTGNDTDSTYVTIHPLPVVTVSSNAPLCTGAIDTLLLSVTPLVAGETFSWTGPDGFTSVLQFPSIPGFLPVNAGVYKVVVTTSFGCHDSGTVNAIVVPPPPPPPIAGITSYCYGATFVPFVVTGSDIMWYPHDTSTVGSPVPPVVNTSLPGVYTYYATQQLGSCLSPKDSITVKVYPRIGPDFDFTIHRGCASDAVDFVNTSTNSAHYAWNFGDGSGITDTTAALLSHTHTYTARNLYSVTITAYNAVCSGDTTIPVDTRHSVQALFTPVPDTFCVNYTTTFNNASTATVYIPAGTTSPGVVTGYLWNFGDGSPVVTDMSPTYSYNVAGTYPVTLVVTDSISCKDTLTENVYVLQMSIHSVNDTTLCLSQPLPLYNTITLTPNIILTNYNYVWTQSAPNLSDTSVHVPFLSGFGDFTDTLTVTLPGILPDGCPARDTITVHSILGKPVTHVTPSTTIPYGSSIDLYATGQVLYWWVPDDGSLNNNNINNPVATPLITTTYTVFGLDGNGCLDSALVTISIDTTVYRGFPGAFTPNGDGLNDVLFPLGLKYQKLVEYRIFNRWGQQVFYSNEADKGWDGTYQGVPQDVGVYYYEIIVAMPNTANNTVYKGDVTLLR